MNRLDFKPVKSTPKIVRLSNLAEGRLLGLDSFLSKPIDIRNSTETTESYTGGGGTNPSNCSDYCPTSTCAQCC